MLKVLGHICNKLKFAEIVHYVDMSKNTILKVKNTTLNRKNHLFIKHPVLLGGSGAIVHIDEVMINHKIKAHRRRPLSIKLWFCVS